MTAATPTPTTTNRIFKAIARFARKAIKYVFKTFAATVLASIILAIILPIGFFAMRAGQPMEAPQFNGLTFYQYMTWRIESYKANSAQYQAMHPNVAVKVDACYIGNLSLAIFAPMSEYYTLAGKFPALRLIISPWDYKYIPLDATLATFPSDWWTTYESMISSTIRGDQGAPVVYCRLPQYPPTPEQLTAQKP
jgi:hypothetical protein